MAGPDNPAYVIRVCPNCHRRADTTEVTPIAITTGDTEKKCVVTPLLLPDNTSRLMGVFRRDCQSCCFLGSDESSYVAAGIALFVDGGAFRSEVRAGMDAAAA